MAGSVSGPSALWAFVVRTDPSRLVPVIDFPLPGRLVAGILASRTTRSQTVRCRDRSLCTWRRDAVQGRNRSTGYMAARYCRVYRVGDLVHVFLLVGLMLLLLAMLKTRDTALRPPSPPTED